jgi:hypothetical protein
MSIDVAVHTDFSVRRKGQKYGGKKQNARCE